MCQSRVINEKINQSLIFSQKLIPTAFWRALINTWSLLAMVLFTYEFINGNPHPHLNTQLTIIYIGVLTIYVGTKEFRRWNDLHQSTRYGELYVILWTALMVIFCLLSVWRPLLGVSPELAATYIAVLSIFAITHESKHLHQRRHGGRK